MKVLVTGAGGYIGSIATKLLLEQGYSVVALDNLSRGHKQPLVLLQKLFPKKLKVFYQSLDSDLTEVFEENEIEAALHYAALCSVDESMKSPKLYFTNNTFGTLNLLETMIKFGVKKLIFSSTCAVYGQSEYIPVDENHPVNPENPYGASKLASEQIINAYSKVYGLKYVVLRYFNVCGASDDGVIGDSKKPSLLLVQNAVRGALGIEKFYLTCPEVDTPDKTPIRDYINVVDLNLAHLKALDYLKENEESQIINLGTGSGNSVLEVVNLVQKLTGAKIEVSKTTPRQGEYTKMIASIKKAKKVLGWEPKRKIDDSIKSLIMWYKANPQGWN